MRRTFLAVTLVLGTATVATAQMPGDIVGSAMVKPVGTELPKVGKQIPRVGSSIPNLNQAKDFSDPFGLKGYGIKQSELSINPSQSISPYPQGPVMPQSSIWDKLYGKWLGLFGSNDPAQRTNWTPGLARRNRERAEARNFPRD